VLMILLIAVGAYVVVQILCWIVAAVFMVGVAEGAKQERLKANPKASVHEMKTVHRFAER